MVHVAVLANINGNLPALAKALERIEELKEEGYQIEKYYILGNTIGLFPYPGEVLDTLDDLIKRNTVKVIRGEFDQIIAASDPHAEGPDYIDRLDIPAHIKAALKYTWEALG
ncbi:MAG: metallophosphatase family protein, partial [Thermococcus sp.]|nr:metallophosphatase family protein [Thermococcus sp.]